MIFQYFNQLVAWKKELFFLHDLLISEGLDVMLKWSTPCYTTHDSNVAILVNLKDKCGISFFKGSLMEDKYALLQSPGPNSKQAKMLTFSSLDQIMRNQPQIQYYIKEAISVQYRRLQFAKSKFSESLPIELLQYFEKDETIKLAFYNLTPGRQRGYILHYTNAKQEKTRKNRIEKTKQKILNGYGLHDCICGLSNRMPTCDGSHKSLL